MASASIDALLREVRKEFGQDAIELYGTVPTEKRGTGFTIRGIPATFSVITLEGSSPYGRYDIQIEGLPLGDYVYSAEVSLEEFISIVARFTGPKDQWP